MIECPFCGSQCSKSALLCPFCKIELPEVELLSTYRVLLERDRALLETSNRKILDNLAKKEFEARAEAKRIAQSVFAAHEAAKEEETIKRENEQRIQDSIKVQYAREQNKRKAKKYSVILAPIASLTLVIIFIAIPKYEEHRLISKYSGSITGACNYAKEVNSSISNLYVRLEGHLRDGKKFDSRWEFDVTKTVSTHVTLIREKYMNDSAFDTKVLPEMSTYENLVVYDLTKLANVFSREWVLDDLRYYNKSSILKENDNFINWCSDRNA